MRVSRRWIEVESKVHLGENMEKASADASSLARAKGGAGPQGATFKLKIVSFSGPDPETSSSGTTMQGPMLAI